MKYVIVKKQNEQELEGRNPISFDDIIVCEERNDNIEMVIFDSIAEAGIYKVSQNIHGSIVEIPTWTDEDKSTHQSWSGKHPFVDRNSVDKGHQPHEVVGDGEPPVKGVGGLEINPADIIADAHLYKVTDGCDEPDEVKYFIAINPFGALKAWEVANNVVCSDDVDVVKIELIQTDFLETQMNLQTNH